MSIEFPTHLKEKIPIPEGYEWVDSQGGNFASLLSDNKQTMFKVPRVWVNGDAGSYYIGRKNFEDDPQFARYRVQPMESIEDAMRLMVQMLVYRVVD